MDVGSLTRCFERARAELTAYLTRMVARPALAEELVQSTWLKAHEAMSRAPGDAAGLRRWLFRIATNLALDELRRHATWRETIMDDLRTRAEEDPEFVKRSQELVGTPETACIAREHLSACFACVLRGFPPHKAATLLLREVYGFALEEVADCLQATPAQAKNWLQETRAVMDERYGRTCALVSKQGVCHQCEELAGFFRSGEPAPLSAGSPLEQRLALIRHVPDTTLGPWHRMLLELIDDDGRIRPKR